MVLTGTNLDRPEAELIHGFMDRLADQVDDLGLDWVRCILHVRILPTGWGNVQQK